ncbi:MAG TPA: response regulator transcription factor, partial [Anaerolineae bacterium]|nr:response regulator transcription factor [Anaerolineae bacterium]
MPDKILIIEDDTSIATLTRLQLETKNFSVQIAHNGADGLRQAYAWQPDLVLLDVMMPDMDGWSVCQRLRELSDVPVIFVTAVGQERNIVRGLQMGADDYIIKPFSTKELHARIEAVLRRRRSSNINVPQLRYTNGGLTIDNAIHQVTVNGKPIDLSPIEFRLLATLVQHEGKVLSHEYLLEQVWGAAYKQERHYLKLYVWYLRQKIEPDVNRPQYILTERGIGYRFVHIDAADDVPASQQISE